MRPILLTLLFGSVVWADSASNEMNVDEEEKLYIRMLPSKHIRVGRVMLDSILSSIREAVDKAVDDFWAAHPTVARPLALSSAEKPSDLLRNQLDREKRKRTSNAEKADLQTSYIRQGEAPQAAFLQRNYTEHTQRNTTQSQTVRKH